MTITVPEASSFKEYPSKAPWAIVTIGASSHSNVSRKNPNPDWWEILTRAEEFEDHWFKQMFDEDSMTDALRKMLHRVDKDTGEHIMEKSESLFCEPTPFISTFKIPDTSNVWKGLTMIMSMKDNNEEELEQLIKDGHKIDITSRTFHIPRIYDILNSTNFEN
ncbi:hypothetical protein BDK51DRAFT_29607, partial [Blyttiomyces helicus]